MQPPTNIRSNGIRNWLTALLALGLVHSLACHGATTEADRLTVLEQKLDQSLQLIRDLSARVHELEAQVAQQSGQPGRGPGDLPDNAPPSAAKADTTQRLEAVEQTVNQLTSGAAQRSEDPGLPLHGFADVGIGNHNATFPEYKLADVGSLDFFLTPRLGAHTRALFELNFEVGDTGNVGVDLERAQIGYQFADSATVWLGRFHTPYGYYNTAFHHGQQIATSLRRPRFLQFEDQGGVLPAHTVGAWLTGSVRTGDQKVTYDLYVGNSQRITDGTLDMNNPGNTHGTTIVGGNLGLLLGGALDGLKVGVHAFTTRIEDQDREPFIISRVRSYGVYAAYDTDRWEHIAEFYIFNNYNLIGTSGTHRSEAGFAQFGYRAGLFTPYARYERAALQQADNYFAAQNLGSSYFREALGVRFDVDLKSALKLEVAHTHDTDRDFVTYDEALLQYAIRF